MSTWRVAAIVVGCGFFAVWAAASAGACVYARGPADAAPLAPAARPAVHTGGVGLTALESPSPPARLPHRRNLFRVRERPLAPAQDAARVRATLASTDPVNATPASLQLTLAGIGESQQGDRAVRTAVISGAGELWLVTEGMVVAGRYRVDRIDRDAVVMVDTADGQPRTLRLR